MTITLLSVSGGLLDPHGPASATITIANDERTVVAISASKPYAAVGPFATLGQFTITRRDVVAADLTVQIAVSGSATPSIDYMPLPSSIIIPAGQASTVLLVRPIQDGMADSGESVVVTIAPDGGYTIGSSSQATIQIMDTWMEFSGNEGVVVSWGDNPY